MATLMEGEEVLQWLESHRVDEQRSDQPRNRGDEKSSVYKTNIFFFKFKCYLKEAPINYLRAQTAGSVISSRSPAAIIVRTRASTPPNWQTATLFFWLLQVCQRRAHFRIFP